MADAAQTEQNINLKEINDKDDLDSKHAINMAQSITQAGVETTPAEVASPHAETKFHGITQFASEPNKVELEASVQQEGKLDQLSEQIRLNVGDKVGLSLVGTSPTTPFLEFEQKRLEGMKKKDDLEKAA